MKWCLILGEVWRLEFMRVKMESPYCYLTEIQLVWEARATWFLRLIKYCQKALMLPVERKEFVVLQLVILDAQAISKTRTYTTLKFLLRTSVTNVFF